ncbi:NlpC/P60 family protein [Bacillus sp. CGMCC 1.16607]|uniref:C40 family peptidase n=1 Tax=Bacillus sp. CGMCC 1.16607 TaxID=3351842 RepID=UPI003645D74B
MILPFTSAQAASQQEEIIATAKDLLGVKYQYGGTTPSGFDCSGFLVYVFGKAGIDLPRRSADQYQIGQAVSKADLEPGDLVFFGKSGITHAGMYVGDNKFISATSSRGIKIDSLSDSYWGPKYVGAKRVLEVKVGIFKDLPVDHPAYEAIDQLSSQNIIKGLANNTFEPENPVTRGQAAAIVNRVLKYEPTNLESFADVPATHSFAKDIAAMKELGIINGKSADTFAPEDFMTRAEMAVIVARAFKLSNDQYTKASEIYTDIAPGTWYYDATIVMHNIDKTGIFKGDRFQATSKATRAVFSAAIYNSINLK